MKKFFLLIGILLIFIISCSDTNTSYEVEMDAEEINWPFESIDNGKFTVLFKNSTLLQIFGGTNKAFDRFSLNSTLLLVFLYFIITLIFPLIGKNTWEHFL